MGSKIVYYQFTTDQPIDVVMNAAKRSLMLVGGEMQAFGNNLNITQGNQGVNFAFTANLEAIVSVKEAPNDQIEVMANINWKPNGIFWACLIIGFFIFGILWIIPLLYLFLDPTSTYQQALFSIPNNLPRDR
jgi:hypothetical protein